MDADFEETRRDYISRREQRWSMNSQRLEEIVAELMRPISDVRRTFDTDLSALLEEYLTEAGLHALDAGDEDAPLSELDAGGGAVPNFAELALLLQQSASIYGRKVDFLYQHVLTVSDSLHNSTLEQSPSNVEETATAGGSRRKRKASVHCDFTSIELEASEGAQREPCGVLRPPPTLPRLYLELEPRVLGARDAPLTDYSGEPIGLLTDFHVTWRLQAGLLVEELRAGAGAAPALRPVPLGDLQAAIEAVAPPPLEGVPIEVIPPPPPADPPPADPPSDDPLPAPAPTPAHTDKHSRKRRSDVQLDDIPPGTIQMKLTKAGLRKLRKIQEFSVEEEWVRGVVARRKACILRDRRLLRAHRDPAGFLGWSAEEASLAAAHVTSLCPPPGAGGAGDSDDDGFFEQSSLGDSDTSRVDETLLNTSVTSEPGAEWTAWQARVVRRAHENEGKGADVRALAARVLAALPDGEGGGCSFTHVLGAAAHEHNDVSKLFLATLFLANAGNVQLQPGPPLSLDSFSVRLVTRDARLYSAAAAAAHPPPPHDAPPPRGQKRPAPHPD